MPPSIQQMAPVHQRHYVFGFPPVCLSVSVYIHLCVICACNHVHQLRQSPTGFLSTFSLAQWRPALGWKSSPSPSFTACPFPVPPRPHLFVPHSPHFFTLLSSSPPHPHASTAVLGGLCVHSKFLLHLYCQATFF